MSEADFARIGNYALMLQPDQNIDRRKCKRVVPMEVLSLGLPRTGTLSMQRALSILGYQNPYHFSSLLGNVKDCDMWNDAFDSIYSGKGLFGKTQWDQLLGHCGAVTDSPCAQFGPQLMDSYPSAKVVLVQRDIDNWFRSFTKLIEAPYSPLMGILNVLDTEWIGRINKVGYTMVSALTGGYTKQQCLENAKGAYVKHYKDIRDAARNRGIPVLEYQLGAGWQPLCEFLGRPIPRDERGEELPFPRMNEEERLEQVFTAMAKRSLTGATWKVLWAFATVATLSYAIWFATAQA